MKRLAVLLIFVLSAISCAEESLLERARNLYDVQAYQEALSLYERVLADDPDDVRALDLSGWCLRYMNEWKQAEVRFNKALEITQEADTCWVYMGLGEVLLESHDYARAKSNFETAMKLVPDDMELVSRAQKGIAISNKRSNSTEKIPAQSPKRTNRELPQLPKPARKNPVQPPAHAGEIPPASPTAIARETDGIARKPAKKFGITLGVPIDEVKLPRRQINQQGAEIIYAVSIPVSNLPKFVTGDAKNIHFQLVEHSGKLLKISYTASYTNLKNTEKKKDSLEKNLIKFFKAEFGEPASISRGVFCDKINWINKDRHIAEVTIGDDLSGQIMLEVSFIDIGVLKGQDFSRRYF